MAFRIQLRRDSSDKWVINNPILLEGEFGYETDTAKMKIGDGVTPWNDLPYWYGAFQGEIGTYFNGVGVTAGATGLNFTGSGVSSVTDSNGLTTITITGGTGGGSAINTYFSGAEIGTGITGLNFTGTGVSSVTDSSGYTTITITGGSTGPTGAPGFGVGIYYALLAFSSGNLIGSNAAYPTATCFVEAKDPNGNNLLGATGWTFTKNAAQELTIGHPTGQFALDFNRIVENTAGTYLTASVGVNSTTGNYIQQVTARNSINVKGLSNTFTGINSAASGGSGSGGEWLFYLTWQFPSITF